MRHNEILDTLQNLTGEKPKQKEIAEALGMPINTIGNRAVRNSNYSVEEIERLSQFFKCNILSSKTEKLQQAQKETEKQIASFISLQDIKHNLASSYAKKPHFVEVTYRPDVYLSAGYGVEVYEEQAETMLLDERLFFTDKGNKINPKECEIVKVSGNSMSPEYRHGDRVIIDKSITEFSDGHIFAFRYKGECYIKEICLLGDKIKAIPLNSEYDSFYIDSNEDIKVFGRIVPRIRL